MTSIEQDYDLEDAPTFSYSLMENEETGPGSTTMLICGDFFVNAIPIIDDCKANRFDEEIISLIQNADISIVNLEAPATLSSNKMLKSGPSLLIDPDILSYISKIGFNGVTLANNHIMDYGLEGLMDTLLGAKNIGLFTCGAGLNICEAVQPIIIQRSDGLKIYVFSFCEKEFGVSDQNTPGSAWISDPSALLEITKCRDSADFILVIAHGGLEYLPLPPPERQAQLRQFIDAGADMVIGHHPHVPQGWEQYEGKYIFYSTGNFIFDKLSRAHRPETEWGYMVQLQFDSKKMVDIRLILTEDKMSTVKTIKDGSYLKNRIAYLNTLSDIVQDPELYCQYWQEMAIRCYYDRYIHLLSSHFFPNLFIAIFNLIRGRLGRNHIYPQIAKEPGKIRNRDLALLNIIRNESHSWAIKRALCIITMQELDLRSNDTKCQIDRLFMWAKGYETSHLSHLHHASSVKS